MWFSNDVSQETLLRHSYHLICIKISGEKTNSIILKYPDQLMIGSVNETLFRDVSRETQTKGNRLKNNYIADMEQGLELIDEPLMFKDLVRRTTKDNRAYVLCTLSDRSGQMSGVYWDIPDQINQVLRPGMVMFVTGKVSRYKDSLQIGITDSYPHDNPDLTDFMPGASRTTAEMVEELKSLIGSMQDPWQGFLTHLLLNESFLSRFSESPAAIAMHHASVGGLLEHSLSMARLAESAAANYPHVNRDLLVSGALVHDMGKVWEYTLDGEFGVSDDGHLVGHITRAAIHIESEAGKYGKLEGDDLRELLHLVVSHHGTLEWGSPVQPKTLEAILLHQLDLMDSRVQGYFDFLRNEPGLDGWTPRRSFMHNTHLRAPKDWT